MMTKSVDCQFCGKGYASHGYMCPDTGEMVWEHNDCRIAYERQQARQQVLDEVLDYIEWALKRDTRNLIDEIKDTFKHKEDAT